MLLASKGCYNFSETHVLGSFPSNPHLSLTWALGHLVLVDPISPYHYTHFSSFLSPITSEIISVLWHLFAFSFFQ